MRIRPPQRIAYGLVTLVAGEVAIAVIGPQIMPTQWSMVSLLAGGLFGVWLGFTASEMIVRSAPRIDLRIAGMDGSSGGSIHTNAAMVYVAVSASNYGDVEERITQWRGRVYRPGLPGRRFGFNLDAKEEDWHLPPASSVESRSVALQRWPRHGERPTFLVGNKVRIRLTAVLGHDRRTVSAEMDATTLGAWPLD
ncbi:MAG: hypothetical protein F4151_05690 [Gammaproteobacteria bacterium]|nr:hypothetical protein [Gammaproteobacteria bacterium]